MKILKLTDLNVRHLRATHPAFAGTRLLARGSFCAVFEMQDPNRVLKLTTDRAHANYLTDWLSPQGAYKPEVLTVHSIDAETEGGLSLYLFEVERLQKVQAGSPAKKLASRLMRFCKENARFPEKLTDIKGLNDSLAQFLRELNWFVANYDVKTDLKMDNFMQRTDGTLVISDPVFDFALQDQEFQRLRRLNDAKRARAYAYAHA